ncbi:MAG: hypothetical protein JRG86_00495 [Deltaproteobacteria bacterium]|jgi:hypothetical protein|nr:hypothetical protein [Deltaproteobacteria bacterium]
MDERRAIRIVVTTLCLLWVSAAEAAPEGQEFFSSFEEFSPNTVPGSPFDIGTAPDLATFGGDAFAGFLATPLLYRTGIRSWMVQANGLGTIDFPAIAAEVEFYAVVLSGATSATFVTAFDPLDQQIGPTFVIDPGAGFQFVRFVGPVASIDVENPAGQMNAVDDFGFTSLPEPGLAPAAMAGAALLVRLRGRRARKNAADGSRSD